MNMQNKKTNQASTRGEVTATAQTQTTLIPKVIYHPTIKIQTPGDGAQAKTTKTRINHNQKIRPASACPPRTAGDHSGSVNPVPAMKPQPDEEQKQKLSTQKPTNKPNQKLDQRAATDPDHQKAVQLPGKGPPQPDQIPLGLGVQLDRSVVERVEVLTRGQRTNQEWFSWRKNRITASVAHRIAHSRFANGKSKILPKSYLDAITGEGRSIQTRAMSWGVQMEAEVVRRYQGLKSSALGRPVSVQDCGLFIDTHRPWLAASPDGIVTDSRTGQWLLCLEVKCPYKHRQRRVEDACREDPAFCLEIQEDKNKREPGGALVYHLKTSHSYFTQIQCQLAVTGLQQADLVVFTLKETAIVPVTFDPDLWEETVSKLEVFYQDAVLPHLRTKTHPDTAAAWTPEQ
ncbi:uncharacterized protein LOC113143015 [Mastacembelus armatus]|uniref:Uncharacterized LOC113143015 n=1 Tax=Mastacembelus armatus TaxID=205130 RepID=A0A3Q3MK05_9TELE|nr:uncharacterized protein LOC113143015 [Mastacembelus armatus]